jgi:hypothetical protein
MYDKILPFIPDKNTLAAIGQVAVCHSHLDHIVKMTIKSLTGLAIKESLDMHAFTGSKKLRDKIRRLVQQRFGSGDVFAKIDDVLNRAEAVSLKRNKYVHSFYFITPDRVVVGLRDGSAQPEALPSIATLDTLTEEINGLVVELNTARLKGWLATALATNEVTSPGAQEAAR